MLKKLAQLVTGYPRTVVVVSLLVTLASVILTSTQLRMSTDQDDLIAESLPYHKRYKDYLRSFGDQEYLYVVVDAQHDPAAARAFVDTLAGRLRALPDVQRVVSTIDAAVLTQSALLFLPLPQLRSVLQLFSQPGLTPADLTQWDRLDRFWGSVATVLARPLNPDDRETLAPAFAFLSTLLTDFQHALQGRPPTANVWSAITNQSSRGIDAHGYLTAAQGKYLLLFIMPQKDYRTLAVIGQPLEAIRGVLQQTRRDFPEITAGLTGRPALAADEMAITTRDMTIATTSSMLLIFFLFWIALRHVREPMLVLTTLSIGMSWSYGFAAIAIGSLNLLSIVFSVILVAGVEFGVHVVAHYREARAHGASPHDAAAACIVQTGRGNFLTALTTAVALYSACFTDFQALRELGLISGTGTMLCLVGMLVTLPAGLLLWDSRGKRLALAPRRIERTSYITLAPFGRWYAKPRALLFAMSGMFLLLTAFAPKLFFDHNLLNLQADDLESVRYEHLLTEATDTSTWQAVLRVPNLEQARVLTAQLRTLSTVGRIESAADFVPTEQDEKIALIDQFTRQVSLPTIAPRDSAVATAIDLPHLSNAFAAIATRLEEITSLALTNGRSDDVTALSGLLTQVDGIRTDLRASHPETPARLRAYQQHWSDGLHDLRAMFLGGLQPVPLALAQLPEALHSRYVSNTGDLAVYVTPRQDVWDPHGMDAFVRELRRIDPNVTGVPVEVYESSRLLERSFRQVALSSLIAIFLLVWIDFRNLRDTCLAMAPLAFGLMTLAGIMGIFHIPLNLANFFAIPIIIGIAIDNGVQIIHRYRLGTRSIAALMTGSTGTGALLASLTALLSFCTMCFAAHRGIRSLGLVMTIGVATSTIGAILLLPALLGLQQGSATADRAEEDRQEATG